MKEFLVFTLAVVGGMFVGYWLLVALRVAVEWLRWHVLRRSPIKWHRITLNNVRRLEDVGWRLRMSGFFLRHVGVGVVWGSPPIYGCDYGCSVTFRTEAEAIEHEQAMHTEVADA